MRRTHNRGIDPQLPIRTERPLSREIAKMACRTLAKPISEKIGFPEFARIIAMASIDILPSPILPWNRETPPVTFASHEWPPAAIRQCARKVDRYRIPLATRLGRNTAVADRKRAA
jgi:hypothetical protein